MSESVHVPVMRDEVISALAAEHEGVYLDCTLGGGGHTRAILEAHPKNEVVAVDRDLRAVERGKLALAGFGSRIEILHAAFSDLQDLLGHRRFNGILADLGISSDQLGEGRGFSFRDQTELDMRMDQSCSKTAATVVNQSTERELIQILKRGGVKNDAKYLARKIIDARPLSTALDLARLVQQFYSTRGYTKKVDPATLVFQAIRIEVNDEFIEIEKLLEYVPSHIEKGGHLVVIAFHSLEDELVTGTMRSWENKDTTPALWRGARETGPSLGKVITRKATTAGEQEIEANPRARSARLRTFKFN